MPYAELRDLRIHYALDGPAGAPVLVYSHPLGADLHIWDSLVKGFTGSHRVLRYDTRGHGQSGAPAGLYTVPMLGLDVLALLKSLKIDSAVFCGLSIGGLTGIWLGLYAGSRISKVILASTAARVGTPESWNERIRTATQEGLAPLAGGLLERWFTAEFRQRESERMEATLKTFLGTSVAGYCGCCAALREADFYPSLGGLRKPALVFSGAGDAGAPPAEGQRLAKGIAGAEYCELKGRHLAPLEDAEAFTRAAQRFLG